MNDYANALTKLYGLVRVGEKYSLDGPRTLESALGHPLKNYKSILVGGTNGKGSTSICFLPLQSGLKVDSLRRPIWFHLGNGFVLMGPPFRKSKPWG